MKKVLWSVYAVSPWCAGGHVTGCVCQEESIPWFSTSDVFGYYYYIAGIYLNPMGSSNVAFHPEVVWWCGWLLVL